MKKAKIYFCSSFKTSNQHFIRYLYAILSKTLLLSAILDFGGHLELPKDANLAHHPVFKSGYPYQLISAKTFSIDAIARSSWVHAGLRIPRISNDLPVSYERNNYPCIGEDYS